MHLEEPDKSTDMAQQAYSKAAKLDKGQGQTEIKIDGFKYQQTYSNSKTEESLIIITEYLLN